MKPKISLVFITIVLMAIALIHYSCNNKKQNRTGGTPTGTMVSDSDAVKMIKAYEVRHPSRFKTIYVPVTVLKKLMSNINTDSIVIAIGLDDKGTVSLISADNLSDNPEIYQEAVYYKPPCPPFCMHDSTQKMMMRSEGGEYYIPRCSEGWPEEELPCLPYCMDDEGNLRFTQRPPCPPFCDTDTTPASKVIFKDIPYFRK